MKIDISSDGSRVTLYASPDELRDAAKELDAGKPVSMYVQDVMLDDQVELNIEHANDAPND